MKRVLVTGGAGFIGSNFVRHLLQGESDWSVIVLDKLTYAGNLDNLKEVDSDPRYTFMRGDICDAPLVESLVEMGCDYIVNFAAETHVDRSIGDPSDFIMTDVVGTYVLLEAARKHGIKLFVQISTDEVYGEAGDEPSTETSALMPKSPYAASKAGADRLVYSYYATYGLPAVVTRCTNNYGPNQYPEKMIPLFTTNAIDGEPLPVYGDGKNTRDWIHTGDHCRALEAIMLQGGYQGEVFNIGSGREVSVLEMASHILDALGKPTDLIRFVEDRPGHVKRHAVDSSKLRKTFSWESKIPFEEGIETTVRWYVDNEWWWRKIKSGEYKEYYRKMYQKRKVLGSYSEQ